MTQTILKIVVLKYIKIKEIKIIKNVMKMFFHATSIFHEIGLKFTGFGYLDAAITIRRGVKKS